MQDILACCTDIRSWSPGVRYAAELAATLDAALTGIHITPPLPLKTPEGAPASVVAEFIAYAQDEVQAAMMAGPRFATWARQFGVRCAQWQVALGDAADILGVAGNWNDAIVFERKNGDTAGSIPVISEMLLSGFACIVVPESTYAIGRLERIAVIHDGSSASVRALHGAIPLLSKAAHVTLLRLGGTPDRPIAGQAFDPQRHLARHGIAVENENLHAAADEVADALLEAASRYRADLIVGGAAGKSRLGDVRLDPIPRHLLHYASAPLYLRG